MNSSELMVGLVNDAYHNLNTDFVQQYKKSMFPVQFRHNFGTVQVRTYRSAGYTNSAIELLQLYPTSYVFVPTAQVVSIAHHRRHLINSFEVLSASRVLFLPDEDRITDTYHKYFAGQKIQLVIIDNYSLFQRTPREEDALIVFLQLIDPFYELLVLFE